MKYSNNNNKISKNPDVEALLKKMSISSNEEKMCQAIELAKNPELFKQVTKRMGMRDSKDKARSFDLISRIKNARKQAWRQTRDHKVTLQSTEAINRFIDSDKTKHIFKLTEDVLIFVFHIFDARNAEGNFEFFKISLAVVNFLKHRTGKSFFLDNRVKALISAVGKMIMSLASLLFKADIDELTMQSDEVASPILKSTTVMRRILDQYQLVKHSPFVKKLTDIYTYLLSFSLLDGVAGVFVSEKTLKSIKKEAKKECKFAGPDFIYCIFDTITFVCERGHQCAQLGSMQPLFHSQASYEKWMNESKDLLLMSKFLGNPEAHQVDEHKFLGDLARLENQGVAILSTMHVKGVSENIMKNTLAKILSDLQMLKHSMITLESAQAERRTPLGMLIDGGSSVAKSTFAKILYFHYGRVRGKPIEDHYRFVRQATEEFWAGFRTNKWCIHLDDVAAFKNQKMSEVDPSVKEMLQIINQVPFNPQQAELEDKGKTPVRAELVTISTNTYHLNAHAYYEVPLAVQRRVPWVIHLRPKSEYDRMGMIDQSKVDIQKNGDYPDLWDIMVFRVEPYQEDGQRFAQISKYVPKYFFDNIYKFLSWYTTVIHSHNVDQSEVIESIEEMRTTNVCPKCFLPINHCVCGKALEFGHLKGNLDTGIFKDYSNIPKGQMIDGKVVDFAFQGFNGPRLQNGMMHDTRVFLSGVHCDREIRYINRHFIDPVTICFEESDMDEVRTFIEFGRGDKRRIVNLVRMMLGVLELEYNNTPNVRYMITYNEYDIANWWAKIKGIPTFVIDDRTNALAECYDETLSLAPFKFVKDLIETFMDGKIGSTKFIRTFDISHIDPYITRQEKIFSYRVKQFSIRYTPHCIKNLKCLSHFNSFVHYYALLVDKYLIFYVALGFIVNPILMLLTLHVNGPVRGSRIIITSHVKRAGARVSRAIGEYPLFSTFVLGAVSLMAISGLVNRYVRTAMLQDDVETIGKPITITNKDLKRQNPWYKKVINFSSEYLHQDVTPNTNSSAMQCLKTLEHSLVSVRVESSTGAESYFNGLLIGDQYLAITHHCVANYDTYEMTIRWQSTEENHLSSVTGTVNCSNYMGIFHQEVLIIKLPFMTPRKSLQKKLPKKAIDTGIFDGILVSRDRTGTQKVIPVSRVVSIQGKLPHIHGKINLLEATIAKPTVDGDCGGILIVNTPLGPLVAGLHVALCQGKSWVVPLDGDIFPGFVVEDNEVYGGKIELQALSDRSNLNYTETGSVEVYGTVKNSFSATFKSKVSKTIMSPLLEKDGLGTDYLPPPFANPKTWGLNVAHKANIKHKFTNQELEVAQKIYLDHLTSVLTEDDLVNLHPISLEDALNGVPNACYLDSIDLNTSGGYGKPGPKSKHVATRDPITLTKEDHQHLQDIEDCYADNKVYKPVFVTFPKDEALGKEKVEIKQQFRLINNGPMVWNIWMRMHYLPLCKLIQENKFKFSCAPGMVAQGLEWEILYKFLTFYGKGRIVAGDYSKYDLTLPAELILAAMAINNALYKHAGHTNDSRINKMRTSSYDSAFPVYLQKGDIMQFFGSNSSGNILTVIINSEANVLAMICAYVDLTGRTDFFEQVHLMTYGDDNIMGVSDLVPEFNHTAISEYLTSRGMTYTMADKVSESKPYVDISEVEFLKREFRFEPELGNHVAPLREESIIKSLNIGVPSPSMCPKAHMVSVASAALYEYSFYGREKYNEWRTRLFKYMTELDCLDHVTDSLFPSFDDLLVRYHEVSRSTEKVAANLIFDRNDAQIGKTAISETVLHQSLVDLGYAQSQIDSMGL